ncbi:lipopolysaccharide transport periplasmic protein LptA [Sulfurimonas sp.]
MKYILVLAIFLNYMAFAEELKIKANSFSADEHKGISIFSGDVRVQKLNDELNASKVTIFTDKKNQPTKFIAIGKVAFKLETKKGAKYEGKANKVIYIPQAKEYRFYGNVHLRQVNEKKEIIGNEVVLEIDNGKAFAKGAKTQPVIMIFDIADKKE